MYHGFFDEFFNIRGFAEEVKDPHELQDIFLNVILIFHNYCFLSLHIYSILFIEDL
jgi:hypothetical protein